jgi:hypothetical protein
MMKKENFEILFQKILCFFVENSMNFSLYFPNIQNFHVKYFFFVKKEIMKLFFLKNSSKKFKNAYIKHLLLNNLKIMKNVFFFCNKKKKVLDFDFKKWENLLSRTKIICKLKMGYISNFEDFYFVTKGKCLVCKKEFRKKNFSNLMIFGLKKSSFQVLCSLLFSVKTTKEHYCKGCNLTTFIFQKTVLSELFKMSFFSGIKKFFSGHKDYLLHSNFFFLKKKKKVKVNFFINFFKNKIIFLFRNLNLKKKKRNSPIAISISIPKSLGVKFPNILNYSKNKKSLLFKKFEVDKLGLMVHDNFRIKLRRTKSLIVFFFKKFSHKNIKIFT